MTLQYAYCPTCGTRRVAHGYRCSVCDRLVRRLPSREHAAASTPRTAETLAPAHIKVVVATPERQAVAA